MLRINILLIVLSAKYSSSAPLVINRETDITIIKNYIKEELEIAERENDATRDDMTPNSDEQVVVPFYFNQSNQPVFYLRRGKNGSSIVCFPNNHCVDIGDVGVHP